jgi:hypothetical protein
VNDKYDKGANFDFKLFEEKVNMGVRILDIMVDLELDKIQKILDKCKKEKSVNERAL